MAKQRRPPARPGKSQQQSPDAHGAVRGSEAVGARPASASSAPPRRETYFEAVAVYERGVEALQRHEYRQAMDLLESVLRQYPEEKELHERVHLYLNICKRQAKAHESASPQTVEERLFAATLAINAGLYDQAIAHLRLVRDEDPDNDHALYMLAVAHAQRDEHAEAIAHLERAIALNPENRALARNDPDMQPLHDDDSFRAALEAPASRSNGPIDPRRRRTGR
jgi:tetratricopeptide (TPR) repeat protein